MDNALEVPTGVIAELDRETILQKLKGMEDGMRSKLADSEKPSSVDMITAAKEYSGLAKILGERFIVSPTLDREIVGPEEYEEVLSSGEEVFRIEEDNEHQSKIMYLDDNGNWFHLGLNPSSWLAHYDIPIASNADPESERVRVGYMRDGKFYFDGNFDYQP